MKVVLFNGSPRKKGNTFHLLSAVIKELKAEVTKGEKSDDSKVAKLIDKLIDLVPGAISAVVSTFATPILGGIAGPVTKFVLDKLK